MSVASKTGWLYAMNIIDDYSSYAWSIPLWSKDEVLHALHVWHQVVENQYDDPLKILITDNGKLLSQSMTSWCQTASLPLTTTIPLVGPPVVSS